MSTFINHINGQGETLASAAIGIAETSLISEYCVYRAELEAIDFENKTITVNVPALDDEEIEDVQFIAHTDIDYFAYIDNELTVPGDAEDRFEHAVYTLTGYGDEYVLLFKHNTDSEKNFAVPFVDSTDNKDTFDNCPGTTYYCYAIFEFKVTDGGSYDERYYLIWDTDNDEPAKIVNDSGDLIEEEDWPVHEDDLDDWWANNRLSQPLPTETTPTVEYSSLQARVPNSYSESDISDCAYSIGTPSWTKSGSNWSGNCDTGNSSYTNVSSSPWTFSETITNGATYDSCYGIGAIVYSFEQSGSGYQGGKGTIEVSTFDLSIDFNHQLSTTGSGNDSSGTFKAIFGETEHSWSASYNATGSIDNWKGYVFLPSDVRHHAVNTLRKNALFTISHTNTNVTGTLGSLTETAYTYYSAITTDAMGEVPETNGALTTLLNSVSDDLETTYSSYTVTLHDLDLRYAKYDTRIPGLE